MLYNSMSRCIWIKNILDLQHINFTRSNDLEVSFDEFFTGSQTIRHIDSGYRWVFRVKEGQTWNLRTLFIYYQFGLGDPRKTSFFRRVDFTNITVFQHQIPERSRFPKLYHKHLFMSWTIQKGAKCFNHSKWQILQLLLRYCNRQPAWFCTYHTHSNQT